MSNKIEKYTFFGKDFWKTSIDIPIELYHDKDYLNHVKKQLKEKCIKEYIEQVPDSFHYDVQTFKYQPLVTLSLELENLLKLKERNRRLVTELNELFNDYKILNAKLNRLR